jgi:hypothetical protein
MNQEIVKTDYLVIGAGAMGMAFADVLVAESDATITLVDRYHRPGGHWNVAYPFVRLHQPSSFYGVNSRVLGNNTIDQVGYNKGLYELASGAEVLTYFDQVMQQYFLPSGRVQYFPMSEYVGDGVIKSLVTSEHRTVDVTLKIVDATYMNVSVPAMRPPPFPVADGMRCVPVNGLVNIDQVNAGFVVIGAGKTGMDACSWLLQNQVDPDTITWIKPRDSWLLNRANLQPENMTEELASRQTDTDGRTMVDAESVADLFDILENTGHLLRIDPTVPPHNVSLCYCDRS